MRAIHVLVDDDSKEATDPRLARSDRTYRRDEPRVERERI